MRRAWSDHRYQGENIAPLKLRESLKPKITVHLPLATSAESAITIGIACQKCYLITDFRDFIA